MATELELAQQQLAAVQASINVQIGAAGAAQYTVQGITIIRASLKDLREMERELKFKIKRLDPTNTGAVRYPVFATRG